MWNSNFIHNTRICCLPRRRDEILGTTTADFHRFADALEAVQRSGRVVAVTSADKLAAAEKEREGFFQAVKRVL